MRFLGWALLCVAILMASYDTLGLPRGGTIHSVSQSFLLAAHHYPLLGVLFGVSCGWLLRDKG